MNPRYYKRSNDYMDLFEQALQRPQTMLSSAARTEILALAYADYHPHIADEFLNPHTLPIVYSFYAKSLMSLFSPTTWLTWAGILKRNKNEEDYDDPLIMLKDTLNDCLNRFESQRDSAVKSNNKVVFKEKTLVQLFHERGHEKTVCLLVSRGADVPL